MEGYISLTLLFLTVFTGATTVQVRVSEGILEGEVVKSFRNNTFASFKGIPYAAPPVGNLRFAPPQPPNPWSGVKNATAHGQKCPQVDILTNELISGDENCLYLNVYTPQLDPDYPLPVMVFIHGGGFKSGSGDDDFYGPSILMDYGVVLVTLNYRLEALGFLSLENEEVPGNAGMKDQVLALKWVQKNIRKFGGDPDKVTIFGQSAGGACIAYHLLSPMSKGLFKRVISMSGVPFNDFATPFRSRDKAFILGKQLGFATDDSTALLEYLRSVSSDKLVNTNPAELAMQELINNIVKMYYFGPVVEGDYEKPGFLTKSAEDIIRDGVINDVDIMIGHTDKEALVLIDEFEQTFMPQYDRYPEMVVPTKFLFKYDPETILHVSKIIRNYYFGNNTIDMNMLKEFVRYLTESSFSYDIDRFMKVLPMLPGKTKYKYRFSAVSDRNVFGNQGLKYGISGAAHVDDLMYLFEAKALNMTLSVESEEYILVNNMCTLFTNFAKYGNPTPDDALNALWPEYNPTDECYMEIGNTLIPGCHLTEESTQFWENVFDYVGLDYYP